MMKKIYIILVMLLTLGLVACAKIPEDQYHFDITDTEILVALGYFEELPLELDNLNISDLEFTIADPEVISISDNYIIGNQVGETTITITSSLVPDVEKVINVEVIGFKPLFNTDKKIFEIGERVNIRLTNAVNEDYTWTVDNPEVGSLDEKNWFSALTKGFVNITVVSKTDPSFRNTLEIEVIERKPNLSVTTAYFQVGDSITVYVDDSIYQPSDYLWSVSNPSIVNIKPSQTSLTGNYIVTGLQNGTTQIIAALKNDERVRAEITVTVGEPNDSRSSKGEPNGGPIVFTGFNESATVQAGESLQFVLAGANDYFNYRWTSHDTTIVQVNDDGVIYGAKEGRARVTVALKEDLSIRGQIIVNVVGTPNVDYRKRILESADSVLGTTSGPLNVNRFTDWYPYHGAEWCAIFVSWAANYSGIPTDIIPKFALCTAGWEWFEENAVTHLRDSDYVPQPGDIIFFSNHGDKRLTHVGIVYEAHLDAPSPYIRTIEGNTSDRVAYRDRYLTSYVYGYGVPQYPEYNK